MLGTGSSWEIRSSLPEIKLEHELIRAGPYSILRHPIYTGILLDLSGTVIAIGTIWLFCCFLIVVLIFIIKIFIGEKIFSDKIINDSNKKKSLR